MSQNPPKSLSRRDFLIYSSAATAVATGVVLKTDALAQNAEQNPQQGALVDPNHTIYGYGGA